VGLSESSLPDKAWARYVAGGEMKTSDTIIVGLCRLHLPDYNNAAWEIEGKYLYPQFKTYEEYREYYEAKENDDE
jgi:hypothetical protein